MKTFDQLEIRSTAVAKTGLHAVYIANHLELDTDKECEIWVSVNNRIESMFDHNPDSAKKIKDVLLNSGMIFFDSVIECDWFFGIFNEPLVYGSGLYVQKFDSSGELVGENT